MTKLEIQITAALITVGGIMFWLGVWAASTR